MSNCVYITGTGCQKKNDRGEKKYRKADQSNIFQIFFYVGDKNKIGL